MSGLEWSKDLNMSDIVSLSRSRNISYIDIMK
jgi:hypothetical protein